MNARRLSLAVTAAACAACLGCAAAVGRGSQKGRRPTSALDSLRLAIDSMADAPHFRNAHWGILIVDPDRGDTLYSRNAGKLFMPASNMKIVTGAVALILLGPDYRFRTTLALRGTRRDSVLDGDLVVHGRGDPSFSDRMRSDAMAAMRELADSLQARGIARITGRVLPGADVFPGPNYGAGWAWDDLAEAYSAGVDELLFNEGFARLAVRGGARAGEAPTATTSPGAPYPTIRLLATTVDPPDTAARAVAATVPMDSTDATTSRPPLPPAPRLLVSSDSASGMITIFGTVAAHDEDTLEVAHPVPRDAFIAALRMAFAQRGITVAGRPQPVRLGEDTLVVYESPPLSAILAAVEKPSQNQIAEVLLRTLGLERGGAGTADSGRAVVERQLLTWGADTSGFVVRDGSGLSRYNYLTPETIVRTLAGVRRDPAFGVFYDALPIAGVDGTIAGRMKGTAAQGNARAKTGFIANVRSLSGYVTTADGRLLIFSLICNNWTARRRDVELVQDSVTARLAALTLGAPR